jgi:hypothetical protein
MPVWLELLLNLLGFAGFLALAARGTSRSSQPTSEPPCNDGT